MALLMHVYVSLDYKRFVMPSYGLSRFALGSITLSPKDNPMTQQIPEKIISNVRKTGMV